MKFSRWAVPGLLAGFLLVLGGCSSSAPPYNQTPAITAIVPSNITAGSQDFSIFISGTGFISSSKGTTFGYWNGSPRSTTYNLTTGQLQMTVLASDVATAGQAQLTVVSPPPGGGEALSAATFYIEAPQASWPVISSIAPASASLNAKPPLITITGSNFVVGDVVTWNGQSRASGSAYLDQNHMTIQPVATDMANAGNASISVSDSGLVNASPSVDFAINRSNAASPSVSSLSPSSATTGAPDLQVVVRGSGFVANSTVLWNSIPVATAYLSGSQLIAVIPAGDLATAASVDVSVMTPAPGGGTSSASTFTINAP
ncbi:MAG TPA: IPT/TIG domain-containing protein [Candidatus Dormibacteraeota bacterium]|nr:IPT/TIG domain-containing protein [Candidatus Dormibacteraeota bacterium]